MHWLLSSRTCSAMFLLHMSHDPSMCAAINTAHIKLFQFKNKTWAILVSIPYMLVWLHEVMKLWKYVLAMYSFLLQKKFYSIGYSFANVTQAGNNCWSGNKARNYNTVELVYVWLKHLRIYFLNLDVAELQNCYMWDPQTIKLCVVQLCSVCT